MNKDEMQRRVDAWFGENDETGSLGGVRAQWNLVTQRYGADSPAALGVIEHGMLPACGYGSDSHLDCWSGPGGDLRWTIVYRPDPVSFPGRCFSVNEDGHPSKAEALLAALEAAP
jgi:hypothetical protein